MPIDPFIVKGPDSCYHCGKDHVIEVYTVYNKPIGLSALLNVTSNISKMVKAPIKKARCRNCGAQYVVCWKPDGTLFLDDDTRLNKFVLNNLHDFDIKEIDEDALDDAKAKGVLRYK
jgi:hypothetical protein